jgi:hypothetical protein
MTPIIKGDTNLVFSMSGIVASMETGFAPQSLQADYGAKSKEFVDHKGATIADVLYGSNGTATIPLLFLGGTLPAIGDFVTIDNTKVPGIGSADWFVVGYGAKAEAEGAVIVDVKLKRHSDVSGAQGKAEGE